LSRRDLKDRVFTASLVALSIAGIAPLFHLLFVVVSNGLSVVLKAGAGFFMETPPSPLSRELGGIAPSILGSLLLVSMSLPLTIALSLLASILAVEFPGSVFSKLVNSLVRSFASIPTLVVSMVVYATVVVPMGGFSAAAGSVALAIVTLPYAYTSFYNALQAVPFEYREAGLSLGMSRWRLVLTVMIPVARSAVISGILISMARAMGETAALLFTAGRYRSGYSIGVDKPVDALPLLIFDFMLTPFSTFHEVAWGAAFVLLMMYSAVFISVKLAVKEVRL